VEQFVQFLAEQRFVTAKQVRKKRSGSGWRGTGDVSQEVE
jgi:hypothetical protein